MSPKNHCFKYENIIQFKIHFCFENRIKIEQTKNVPDEEKGIHRVRCIADNLKNEGFFGDYFAKLYSKR